MATASVPVDLLNPGQVFGSLGLLELSEILLGPSKAAFDWTAPENTQFVIEAEGSKDPIQEALRFLAEAHVESLAPPQSGLNTDEWSVGTCDVSTAEGYPIPPPSSSAALPAVLRAQGTSITVSSWGEANLPDQLTTGRDNVKFWAGSKGKPGAAFLEDAIQLIREGVSLPCHDPFGFAAPQSGSLRFDWRRDYVPIDAGFSLNEHKGSMSSLGYPLVETLAAIGVAHARPLRGRNKLEYRYSVLGTEPGGDRGLLPAPFLRAALGTASFPFPQRRFTMCLDWPGQENQARCITQVFEESAS